MTSRSAPARGAIATLLAVLTVTSCGGAAGREDSAGGGDRACEVRQETDQITSRFPSFGPLESTSWCGMSRDTSGDRVPGPTDVRLVGLLDAVDDEAVRKDLGDPVLRFEPATPTHLPAEIRKLLPAGAEWMTSEQVNKRITEDLYLGTFYYDRRSGQVLFDCSNPRRKDGPPPAVVSN
ncbi:hypothetical protein [Streptomyces sp. NPDC051921]|uniref:hypothetical protein n=1 Tax=Streptomyces sp. NPDC051921 TaxID=3155806 RepID=UPI003447AE6C